mmetsp:Transcript_122475/g.329006  ORF Transcript_122475/g.329006 Transcript_122475/m.329006 type:complete len:298 (+) Transcript_122475:622-1515(+)
MCAEPELSAVLQQQPAVHDRDQRGECSTHHRGVLQRGVVLRLPPGRRLEDLQRKAPPSAWVHPVVQHPVVLRLQRHAARLETVRARSPPRGGGVGARRARLGAGGSLRAHAGGGRGGRGGEADGARLSAAPRRSRGRRQRAAVLGSVGGRGAVLLALASPRERLAPPPTCRHAEESIWGELFTASLSRMCGREGALRQDAAGADASTLMVLSPLALVLFFPLVPVAPARFTEHRAHFLLLPPSVARLRLFLVLCGSQAVILDLQLLATHAPCLVHDDLQLGCDNSLVACDARSMNIG